MPRLTSTDGKSKMALTAKQRRFVEEYLLSLNATDAARKAGYAHPTTQGPRLLENVGVAKEIAAQQAERAERVEVTQDYVLSSIVETMERCKQASPVLNRKGESVMVETPDGDLAPAYSFNAKDVLKGAELLGRHLGMFGGEGAGGDDAPALSITMTTAEPVSNIRVTRYKG